MASGIDQRPHRVVRWAGMREPMVPAFGEKANAISIAFAATQAPMCREKRLQARGTPLPEPTAWAR